MCKFGKSADEKFTYINFDNNAQMKELFSEDMRIEQIVPDIKSMRKKLYISMKSAY